MKTKLFILMLVAAVVGLTACSSNDTPVVNPTPTPSTPDTPIQPEPDYESVMCNDAVFVHAVRPRTAAISIRIKVFVFIIVVV